MMTTQDKRMRLLLLLCFLLPHLVLAAPPKTIAITQFLAHPALDKVHDGIEAALKAGGYSKASGSKILFANAQGNSALAAQIAHQFVAERPDIIIAIATPSAQSVASATANTSIPVVFASVTDPIQAKLVSRLAQPGGHITGTRNQAQYQALLELIKKQSPQIHTIGLVYNPGEENAVDAVTQLQTLSKQHGLILKTSPAPNSSEIRNAAAHLAGRIDAFLLLQDNTVAAALPTLMDVANKNNIPVYSLYADAMAQGALASIAPDEYQIGLQTGKMAIRILEGSKAGDLSVEDPATYRTHIDKNIESKRGVHL